MRTSHPNDSTASRASPRPTCGRSAFCSGSRSPAGIRSGTARCWRRRSGSRQEPPRSPTSGPTCRARSARLSTGCSRSTPPRGLRRGCSRATCATASPSGCGGGPGRPPSPCASRCGWPRPPRQGSSPAGPRPSCRSSRGCSRRCWDCWRSSSRSRSRDWDLRSRLPCPSSRSGTSRPGSRCSTRRLPAPGSRFPGAPRAKGCSSHAGRCWRRSPRSASFRLRLRA